VQAAIADICRRVLGATAIVDLVISEQGQYQVTVTGIKANDPLTRSQQEMDIILSLQHRLQGAEIKLRIDPK
jgi:hypothetical protein